MPTSKLLSFTLASALFGGLVACGDSTDPMVARKTKLRVVHASPDAPAVDVYAAGVAAPLFTNLAYGQASAYLEVDEGTYDLQLRPAGQPDAAPAFSTGPLELAGDATITAVAAGLLGSTSADDKFRVLPLVEGFAAPGADQAQVRIVHASADAPTVGVDVGNDDPAAPEVASLARFADTGAAGVSLPAGAALQVGIVAGGSRVTAFTTPALPAGADLFVIATGRLGELPRQATGFGLLAVGPDGVVGLIKQNPTVYALHASPDAPAVDIRVGATGPVAFGGLAFGQLGAAQVPPGDYPLAFYPAGATPGTPVATAQATGLAAGERYLAIATGFLGATGNQKPFQLVAAADAFTLDDNPRLRVVHASPDAPAVDVAVATGSAMGAPLFAGLAFPSASDAAGLMVPAAASIRVGVAPAGVRTAVATFNVDTSAKPRAFVVAAGALAPKAGQPGFRLIAVDTTKTPWVAAAIGANAN